MVYKTSYKKNWLFTAFTWYFTIFFLRSQINKTSTYAEKIHNKIVNNPPDEIWDGRFAYSSLLYTHHHLLFKKLRIQWYEEPFVKKSPKKIPDIFNLNWRLISYWYADDGNNNKAKKTITLSTQSFKIKYIEMLQEKLKYLNVESNIRKNHGYIITIGTKSYEYFIEQIKPYLSSIKCMQYKLDTVNARNKKKRAEEKRARWKQMERERKI